MLFRLVERTLLFAGLTLLVVFCSVLAFREIGSRQAVRAFEVAAAEAPALSSETAAPDYALWAPKRIAAYRDALARHFASPVAILRIPKLRIEVPVYDGTDELNLNRGVGRIEGTAEIGESGNIGIAGHRDGFFRALKDIAEGDSLSLTSRSGTSGYVVDKFEIVAPADVRVLAPRALPSVTLVTCYPFYFSGDAPRRFIVHCSKREERPKQDPGLGRPDQSSANKP